MNLDDFYTTLLRLYMTFPFFGPVLLLISAPHGKFAQGGSRWNVNGKWGWLIMEVVSPVTFLAALRVAIQSRNDSMDTRALLPALFYLLHYFNRAILSVLIAPSNGFNEMNIAVPLSAVSFNFVNGWLNGWWLGSHASGTFAVNRSTGFVLGLTVMVAGFVGNVYHDEILRQIKRDKLRDAKSSTKQGPEARYAVPHGGLFELISQPSYLCEWVEWLGFAIALRESGPAWAFLAAEIGVMLPRALKTHQWYRKTFGARYPSERKAIIPFLL